MYLKPDIGTYAVLPWYDGEKKTARFLCDVYTPDSKLFEEAPRYILKKMTTEAKELGFDALDVRLDSELAVKQLNGEYKVKNEILAKKFLEIYTLRQSFHEITFTHVRRAFNKAADAVVNKTIDDALGL